MCIRDRHWIVANHKIEGAVSVSGAGKHCRPMDATTIELRGPTICAIDAKLGERARDESWSTKLGLFRQTAGPPTSVMHGQSPMRWIIGGKAASGCVASANQTACLFNKALKDARHWEDPLYQPQIAAVNSARPLRLLSSQQYPDR